MDSLVDRISMTVDRVSACVAANKFAGILKTRAKQPRNIYQKTVKREPGYQPPSYDHSEEDRKIILRALDKNFFLGNKSKEELRNLAPLFEECSYKRGARIIEQGETGDFFYVLRSGAVRFVVDGVTVSKTSQKGISFGELSLLYTSPRAASVVAVEDSRLFRVGQDDFRTVLQSQTQASVEKKFKLLEKITFLESVSKKDIKRLAAAMTPHLFRPDEVLLKKGDAGRDFWILQEGKVKATDIAYGSSKFEDQSYGPGDHFGALALVKEEPLSANVTSLTSGIAFTIGRKTFEKILGSMSSLIVKAHDAQVLGGIKFFIEADLDASQLTALAGLMRHKGYPKGETIMKMGSKTEAALYIVRQGQVEIESEGKKVVIQSGGYFGEELLRISDAKNKVTSSLTARAIDTCICSVLYLLDCRTLFDTDVVEAKRESFSENDELETQELHSVLPTKPKQESFIRNFDLEIKAVNSILPTTPKDFKRHLILGEGTFGQVWLVTNKETTSSGDPRPLALKIMSKHELLREGQDNSAKREKEIMEELKHPFIIKLFKTYQDDNFVYCVLDFMQGGELFNVMQPEKQGELYKMPEPQAQFYALAIADALAYMHSFNIVYRDLKSENVMIDAKGYPILIDLGFAKKVVDKTFTFCGTPR
jgi:cAMP-dependent protein kinase regulator